MKPVVVYISYDGMLEPLGQSQVLAYLEHLARNYTIYLLSFEKRNDRRDAAKMAALRHRTATNGINWIPLAYHKWPTALATAFDIGVGTVVALSLALRHQAKIIHVRSYVPAAMGVVAARLTGAKFLFDIRGFWADERVDGGLWPPDGTLYRVAKWCERRFFRAADHVVAMTEASKREIQAFDYLAQRTPQITVIPTCADLSLFKPAPTDVEHRPFVLGYVGSVGSWYLFDEVTACFKLVLEREPDARLLIVNRNEHELIKESLRRANLGDASVEIVSASHREVPQLIARMSAGTAIIKPAYSKIASAPTKLAEYLGCGVPCLGNTHVGDVASMLEGNRIGVALTDFSDGDRRQAITRLLDLARDPETKERCTATARALFSLDRGVDRYRSIYEHLSGDWSHSRSVGASQANEPL